MKNAKYYVARLPGWVASILMIFFTMYWTYWGISEMYHEGWWGAWYNRLPYLAPIAVTLFPTLVAFRWPIPGGILIMSVGIFAFFFFASDVSFIGIAIALIGAAFLIDEIIKRKSIDEEKASRVPLYHRWRFIILLGAPLTIFIGISVYMLPVVSSRMDDFDRSARLIKGNGTSLVWAPAGPGWNWKQSWGGYPSWQSIALYGISPVGLEQKQGYGKQGSEIDNIVYATSEDMEKTNLCKYLSPDGAKIMDTPQNIWRMPTTDEIVQALGRHGENAGCLWQGEYARQVRCKVLPDKESPLWATDQPVIYYWTADSYSENRGYFVAYNGTVNATNKLGGNPRHGYRCVREP